jgi:hypothetical protein
MKFITVDWPAEGVGQSRTLAENINISLNAQPEVLIIRESSFSQDFSGDTQLARALAKCWAAACLPIAVTTKAESAAHLPPGILTVRLIDREADGRFEKPTGSQPTFHSRTPLGLSTLLLSGTKLGREHAALAYIGLAAAALPAKGPLAHLERASLLWQTPETWTMHGSSDGALTFRPFDFSASYSTKRNDAVPLLGSTTPWTSRIADVKGFRRPQAPSPGGGSSPERDVLMGVFGDTSWVLFDTAAQLTDLHPVFLIPDAYKGVVALSLDARRDTRSLEDVVFPYWEAHSAEKKDGGKLVFDVQRNTAVRTGQPPATLQAAPASAARVPD